MLITVKGLVLRETPVGEFDKMLTVLTADKGKISVFARGAVKMKSPFFVCTHMFCYSEFVLRKSTDVYYINDCTLIEGFFELRNTLEGSALASYIADVARDIATENTDEEKLLRLTLNCLYAISKGKKPLPIIKAVFELRAVCYAGFLPRLSGCASCGKAPLPVYFFDISNGVFFCEECYHAKEKLFISEASRSNESEGIYETAHLIIQISPSVFSAVIYVLASAQERIFAFSLESDAERDFSALCEKYLLCHLEREFKTLDFYHSIIS
ncbi:MAG: DNA repair protein RecO [Eubacteriales bacterium]